MIDYENLTLRELEVVESLLNNPDIKNTAKDLHISLSTIKTHVRNIYLKLDVHSLPEMLKFFYEKEYQKLKQENFKLKLLLESKKN
jgi:DNA-binding NarL/FixJ family response regulator